MELENLNEQEQKQALSILSMIMAGQIISLTPSMEKEILSPKAVEYTLTRLEVVLRAHGFPSAKKLEKA